MNSLPSPALLLLTLHTRRVAQTRHHFPHDHISTAIPDPNAHITKPNIDQHLFNEMSCQNILDDDNVSVFPAFYPHQSSSFSGMHGHLRPSSPFNDPWFSDSTLTFERDFCSDFNCCGQSLADLHQLVDHFEEAHVVVIGSDGNRVYPSPRMGSAADSPPLYDYSVTPFSKVVFTDSRAWISDVNASTNLHGTMPTTWEGVRTAGSDAVVKTPTDGRPTPDAQTLLAEFDVLSAAWREVSANQLCLPPSSFTAGTNVDGVQWEVQGSRDHRSPRDGSPRMGKKRPRVGVYRRRDKSHKCPRPGCTKAYMNPNGLKYHLEKGTCSVEPTFYLFKGPRSG